MSAGTGPYGAGEGNQYLYLEASNPNFPSKTAGLVADLFFSVGSSPQLQFLYHMHGATMGQLSVDVRSGGVWNLDVWTRLGQQHSSGSDPWTLAAVDLSSYAGQPVTLRFRGVTGPSYESDIALDAVVLHEVAPSHERTLAAWGDNEYGMLGDGTTTQRSSPVLVDQSGVLAGKTVTSMAARSTHTVALCADGTLAAWGPNFSGQLGDGTTTDRASPALVDRSGVLAGKTVVALTTGRRHTVLLCADGTLASWGANDAGQLGEGSMADQSSPVLVDQSGVLAGRTVVSIAAGDYHTVARCSDGSVAAWGSNGDGQLGDGTTTDRPRPVLVDRSGVLDGSPVVKVAAGDYFTVALCADGTLAAWGWNNFGQLGDGTTTNRSNPTLVERSGVLAGRTVVALAAGGYHTCVLCADGAIAAWGWNTSGQLGNATTTDRIVPALIDQGGVLSGKTVVGISAGGIHTLALCSDGTAVAWGNNFYGQLGDGTNSNRASPVLVDRTGVLADKEVLSLMAGKTFSLAIVKDETPEFAPAAAASTARDLFDRAAIEAGLSAYEADPLSIPIKDGVSNVLKYAFNLNLGGSDAHPIEPDGNSGLPVGRLVEYSGKVYWQMQYVRRKDSGLIYTPMKSATLLPGSFTPMTGIQELEEIDSKWERVTIHELLNTAVPRAMFFRVEVTSE